MQIQKYDLSIYEYGMERDEESLQSALTRHLLSWWLSFAPGRPTYRDFDITDHIAIADHVFLVRVLGDERFDIRLCGEVVTGVIGLNTMGSVIHTRGLAETPVQQEYVRLARYYQTIRSRQCSFMCFGSMTNKYGLIKKIESIDCPLFGPDGTVDYIIGVLVPLPSFQYGSSISLHRHIL